MSKWQTWVEQAPVRIADGAMGTMLQQAGLDAGELPMLWNVTHPDRVRAIQRAYLAAGADIILANTFSGSRWRLARHGLAARGEELNRAGVEILRAEIGDRAALIAGDVGPSGEILAPLGTLAFDEAVAGFAEQVRALIVAGADAIWIETMADLEEVRAAIAGTRQVSAEIPILATLTFDTRGRTMMGVKPETAARTLSEWGVAAFGGNCGNGPDELLVVIQKMRATTPNAILVAKSNAGIPEIENGATVYRATPAMMAQSAAQLRAAGARIIGGCCGTTPAHIAAMADIVRGGG